MHKKYTPALLALLVFALAARADDIGQKGRDVFTASRHAVVTVQLVLKVTQPGSNPAESKRDATGTVVDPSGLTVLALSAIDPAELYRRVSDAYKKMETEVDDVKILLDDGTEMPAEVVLRDKDLDLAYVRPKLKPAAPMAAVDLSKSSSVEVLDPVIALNRLGRAAGRSYSACVERIAAVVQKPRTFYIPETGGSSASLGSPAFALNGNIVGLFVMRAVTAADPNSRNIGENMTVILIPAEEVLKGAKQAPEVKVDTEKPADKPPAPKDQKDAKDQK